MAYDQVFIEDCKKRLLELKEETLNRYKDSQRSLSAYAEEKGGDEADQTLRVLTEKEALLTHSRLREYLLEIESALARISSGYYGICEETEEYIEKERISAIPWTRFSIEGAEIQESKFLYKKNGF